jgi:hypothetical protein
MIDLSRVEKKDYLWGKGENVVFKIGQKGVGGKGSS